MSHRCIHILSGDLWGGAESQAHHLIIELIRRGTWTPSALLFNEGRLAKRLRSAGVDVEIASEADLTSGALAARVEDILRTVPDAIVHTHGYKETLIGGWGARKLGLAAVRTQHGTPYPGTTVRMKIYSAAERWAASRWYQMNIAVSAEVRDELLRFLPEEKVSLVPNGIPLGVSAREEALLEDEGLLIGSAGRFAPEKRYDLLIDAVAALRRRGIDARLLLLGDGPLRGSLEERAKSSIAGAFEFPGFIDEPGPLVRSLDIFVISSDREGLPMAVLEAMAGGVPVVSTAVGGIPDAVDGGGGITVPTGDSEAIADACATLAADKELRIKLATEGPKRVRSRFSVEQTAAATEKIYNSVCHGEVGHG